MFIQDIQERNLLRSSYSEEVALMFEYLPIAHTAASPWTIVKSDDKKRARLNCMQHFLTQLDYPGKDYHAVTGSDPLIVGSPKAMLRPDIHLDDWPLRPADQVNSG